MNKLQAREIAQSGITPGQIKEMLKRAYDAGAANKARSNVNSGITRAVAFNILWKRYETEEDDQVIMRTSDILGAINALREFGEYWEGVIPQTATRRQRTLGDLHHESAIDIYEE